ncbi:MAG: flagellar motor switch protein FliM [Phycisphaerales bacterium]|nr:flagellar motor switch protein FliM [Phycisphaerales bacterium]
MPDTMPQADLETLLSAVESGAVDDGSSGQQIFSRHRRSLEDVEIRTYDFKRPERISKDQIRALMTLHDTFARSFGAAMSGYLRTIVEVNVAQVEQMTYFEFIDALPNPTSFAVVNVKALEGMMCLEISPLIIYPILDRLMGGTSAELFIPPRPMTVIESRLIRQILVRAVAALTEAWSDIHRTDFALGEIESNPQLVLIVPPNEVVVVVRFEIRMAKRAGTMSLCIPFNVIEPVMQQLSAQSWFNAARARNQPTWERAIASHLTDAGLELTATLAETTITLSDLERLEPGDLILTEKPAEEPIVVSVEGRPKYLARLGQVKGKRAAQIVRPIEPGDRV